MPRLLPRLLQKVAYQSLQAQENHVDLKFFRRRPRRKSHKPLPPAPSFSPINRVQSILLDDVNPIINSKAYVLHKALSPRVRTVTSKEDDNRQMTPEEREWWASPYCAFHNILYLLPLLRSCSANAIVSLTEMSPDRTVPSNG
jgi:hypothetical protein